MSPDRIGSECGSEMPGNASASPCDQHVEGDVVELAVFDFDGTCISGNSPVLLVRHLRSLKMLRGSVIFRIALWGAAYKFRLPQSESWVRSLVFSAFEGWPQHKVDEFLYKFYDDQIEPRFRDDAEKEMHKHRAKGRQVIVISATFEPIIIRAMRRHCFCHQISTRMRVDAQGNYTCEVDGAPVEGEEKVHAVTRYANSTYGKGNWVLTYAYGDHHSDRPMLFAAQHAIAVMPDNPLERTAHREKWTIARWK